jgi:hypothetical protein
MLVFPDDIMRDSVLDSATCREQWYCLINMHSSTSDLTSQGNIQHTIVPPADDSTQICILGVSHSFNVSCCLVAKDESR